jgi:hypothetical protein
MFAMLTVLSGEVSMQKRKTKEGGRKDDGDKVRREDQAEGEKRVKRSELDAEPLFKR